MSPERQTPQSATRQKVIVILVLVVLIVVIWQIIGLLKGGNSARPTVPPTFKSAAPGGVVTPSPTLSTGSLPPAQSVVTLQQPPQQFLPKPAPVSKDMELLTLQQETQSKYIAALNELQMLKIQREIGETNQAIVQSKLATVKAEKNINDLLTPQQAPPPVQVPSGAYASQLINGQPTSPPPGVIVSVAEPAYVVISVSYQLGRWTAVVGSQGKLFNVSPGDVLPVDGAVVAHIDRGGIILNKDGKRHRVSLISAI